MGRYQSFFLAPLSYENKFYFWLNLPGLFYASSLIEMSLGPAYLAGIYLFGCTASALTSVATHRHLGFKKVQQRGRLSNYNGNTTLFMVCLFSALFPHYQLYGGRTQATTAYFWWLAIAYGLVFFSNNGTTPWEAANSKDPRKSSIMWGADYNETHISAVMSGVMLGLALRKRFKKWPKLI